MGHDPHLTWSWFVLGPLSNNEIIIILKITIGRCQHSVAAAAGTPSTGTPSEPRPWPCTREPLSSATERTKQGQLASGR
eukprot:SAG31_NODE_42222_length_272_cov_1.109827_1_plen_78_part_10